MASTQTSRSGGRSNGGSKSKSNGKSNGNGRSAKRASSGSDTTTGERDENYNLISVLYHALQGAQTYGEYVNDAETAEDQALVEFFTEMQTEEQERAARAKGLLAARIGSGSGEEEE